jgi:hypothetical protein
MLYGQSTELLFVKAGGTYEYYHYNLKGYGQIITPEIVYV